MIILDKYTKASDVNSLNEAVHVGRKRSTEYQVALLTQPGESPDTFNGQLLSDIKSPSGASISYKFFTGKGTEYIMSTKNESRRIKSDQGNGDDGMHCWCDLILFVPTQGNDDPIDTMLDTAIRIAFRKRIPFMLELNGNTLMIRALLQRKWVQICNLMQLTTNNPTKTMGSSKPFQWTGVSKTPVVGYHVCEFRHAPDGKTISSYHPGHPVSYIEKRTAGAMQPAGKYVSVKFQNGTSCRLISGGYYPRDAANVFKNALRDDMKFLNSKQICPLQFQNGKWMMRPNSIAANAIYLNGKMQNDKFEIRKNDVIAIGSKNNPNSRKIVLMTILELK